MINPEYKARWRPTTDLGRRFDLNPDSQLIEVYEPRNAADALAYLQELALPELVAYDGQPCQADLLLETAALRWTHLFPEVQITEPISKYSPQPQRVDYVTA